MIVVWYTLSYGERARLVLLDEPLNHLDIPSREQFEMALENFNGTILAVVHDRSFVQRFAHRIWALADGRLATDLDLDAYARAVAGTPIPRSQDG